MARVQERKQQNYVKTISQKDLGIKTEPPKLGTSTAFSLWIRSLLQNWRQGTVSCKGRSNVNRSGKKPWKQKGTGRARAGTAKSPLWRGGGIIFGPQPRTAKRKISKNVKKIVYSSFLHDFISQGKVLSLDWSVKNDEPKTKAVYEMLKSANLSDKKLLIFLPMEDLATYASLRNLPNVQLVFFDQPNAFDLAKNDFWVFFKKDINNFKEMVSRWLATS